VTSAATKARIYLSPPHLAGTERRFIEQALDSNWIAPLGPMVDAFEREFADLVGLPHAVALSSGTAAMHLGLRILGAGSGDEVWAPSLTFIGSIGPAVQLGAAPVFLDVDPESWTLDAGLVEEELRTAARRGRLPKAVVPTDLYGQSCDLDRLVSACARNGVPVLADCAEALGGRYKDRHAGDGAAAAVFSFNGNKIITTSGGGMLASRDERIVEEARFLSQQARDPAPHYQHSTIGYNYRLSNVLAAIGRAQIEVLPQRVLRRRQIFELYRQSLDGLPGLSFMPQASWGTSSRWLTVITVDADEFGSDRDHLSLALEAENIEARPVWKPMHLQPVFAGARRVGGEVSERLFRQGLCLPSGTAMTDEDIARIADIIRAHHRR
jgi:dTDP-4-amino-4,6-dideoxygalactose transaminase